MERRKFFAALAGGIAALCGFKTAKASRRLISDEEMQTLVRESNRINAQAAEWRRLQGFNTPGELHEYRTLQRFRDAQEGRYGEILFDVRHKTDTQTFDHFMNDMWNLKS